uniref:Uncharacterized protein n=1 Tax=Arion vulgaris TaxID=1028688 RepID=A0A0B7B0L4_9EUPU
MRNVYIMCGCSNNLFRDNSQNHNESMTFSFLHICEEQTHSIRNVHSNDRRNHTHTQKENIRVKCLPH